MIYHIIVAKDLNLLEDGYELLEAVESEPGLYEYLNTQQREKVLIQGEERIAERRRQVGLETGFYPEISFRFHSATEYHYNAIFRNWQKRYFV